jgi:hypothetical protein
MICTLDAPPSIQPWIRAILGVCLTGQEDAHAIQTSSPRLLLKLRRASAPILLKKRPKAQHRFLAAWGALREEGREPRSLARKGGHKLPVRLPQPAGGSMTTEIAVSNRLGIALASEYEEETTKDLKEEFSREFDRMVANAVQVHASPAFAGAAIAFRTLSFFA